jgi:hypothetical protein
MRDFVQRNLGLIAVSVAALGWLVWTIDRLGPDEPPDEDVAHARAALVACLLGQPIDDPWSTDHRLRRIHIAVHDDASTTDWPMRCAEYAEALERLVDMSDERGHETVAGSERLRRGELYEEFRIAREISDLLRPADGEPDVDWPTEISSPPAPAQLVAELASWPRGASRASYGSTELALMMNRAVCRFAAAAGGLEPVARCTYFPDNMADESWAHGIFIDREGDVALLTRGAPISLATGEPIGPSQVPPSAAASGASIVGDQLLWAERGILHARSIAADELGPVVEVAHPPVPSVPFTGPDAHCEYDDVLASWIESEPASTPRGSEYRIVARIDGNWVLSDPVRGRLDCLPDAAVVTHVRHDDSGTAITQTKCTRTGCRTTEVSLPDVTQRADVAPIADSVVVAWVEDLVRVRIAPLTELPHAPSVPLFDGYVDHRHYVYQGQSVVHRLSLHVRGHSAIVELHTDDTVAIHLSSDGTARPVQVVYE